uniref:Glucuronosyltransferase n=1 Tax=Angiostrongylus cantonensis TaxID=6313 RepID=A0A0K0DRH2_ANGCA
MIQHWVFICSSLLACDAYKFLINSPLFGYSHSSFMGAIADTLTEAGHNVYDYCKNTVSKLQVTRPQLYNVG